VEMLFYILMLMIYLLRGLKSIEIIGYIVLTLAVIYDTVVEPFFSLKYFSLLNHFPLFFAGILFSRIKTDGASVMRYLGLVFCFIAACMLFNNGGRSMYYISFAQYLPVVSIYFIVFFLVVHQHLGFVIQKPLIFMGRISYSFYLVHQYVSVKVIIPGLQNSFNFNFFMAVAVAFFVSLCLASLITRYIEEPCIERWKKSLIKFH
jgi:peptidoglycan/LPS O-acetylase OafA/YrhL